jgi:hypothetical protein
VLVTDSDKLCTLLRNLITPVKIFKSQVPGHNFRYCYLLLGECTQTRLSAVYWHLLLDNCFCELAVVKMVAKLLSSPVGGDKETQGIRALVNVAN